MTAITISTSVGARPRRTAERTQVGPAAWSRGRARRQAAAAPLRLTRRGRLAATGFLAAIAVVASMFLGGTGLAGTRAQSVPVSYVTVAPGETLWSIAGEIAPDTDRRDTVARILELNALDSSAVQAGARLAVPAH